MPPILEIIVAGALLVGTFLIVVASVGLIRFPDIFCRMHAAGKAGTLGIALSIVGTVAWFAGAEPWILIRGGLAVFFQFLTIPAATHLLARASYVIDYPLTERTAVDELESFLPSRPDDSYIPE